jgi:hypothetical protein
MVFKLPGMIFEAGREIYYDVRKSPSGGSMVVGILSGFSKTISETMNMADYIETPKISEILGEEFMQPYGISAYRHCQ